MQANHRSMMWAPALIACLTGVAAGEEIAELRFRPEAEVSTPLVRLADIAEVLCQDPARRQALAETELMPSPRAGESRTLGLTEVQDILAVRPVGLTGYRMSGASRVRIHRLADQGATPIAAASPETAPAHSVDAAIAAHLAEVSGLAGQWRVDARIPPVTARAIAAGGRIVGVSGGRPPWQGRQRFALQLANRTQTAVDAVVSRRLQVLVARRNLRQGERIASDDVQLVEQPLHEAAVPSPLTSIEEALGQEVQRPIRVGQALDRSYLRRPRLVKRGELVRVSARAGGIRIRTQGKAASDGALGDLIEVTPFDSRERFMARVSGPQAVEVWARQAVEIPAARR